MAGADVSSKIHPAVSSRPMIGRFFFEVLMAFCNVSSSLGFSVKYSADVVEYYFGEIRIFIYSQHNPFTLHLFGHCTVVLDLKCVVFIGDKKWIMKLDFSVDGSCVALGTSAALEYALLVVDHTFSEISSTCFGKNALD